MVERFRLPSEILSATDFVVDNGGNYIFLKSISREKKKEEYKLYVYNKKEGTIVNRILNMDKKSSEYISLIKVIVYIVFRMKSIITRFLEMVFVGYLLMI